MGGPTSEDLKDFTLSFRNLKKDETSLNNILFISKFLFLILIIYTIYMIISYINY